MLNQTNPQNSNDEVKFFRVPPKAPSLDNIEVDDTELVDPDLEEESQGQAFKRAVLQKLDFDLGIYPDKSVMIQHLQANSVITPKGKFKWGKAYRVIRETLNVGGKFVADTMDSYLNQNNVKLDENGEVIRNEVGHIHGYFQSSHLKSTNITPRHLYFKLADDLLPKKSREGHFDLGEALHACLMEPTRFGRYVTAPNEPKNTHDGIAVHIQFWKDILFEKLHKEHGEEEGKEAYGALLVSVWNDMKLVNYSTVLDFFHGVKVLLINEKDQLKEGHRFNDLLSDITLCYTKVFNGEEIAFEAKKTEDPYQIVIKELGAKKNESLGENKKGFPFDPFVKYTLLDSLIEACTQYITANTDKDGTEFFTSLGQKSEFMDKIADLCEKESVKLDQYLVIKALELNAKTYGNGIIYKLAHHAHRECSAYLDDYKGLPLKVRPDMVQFAENIGVDAVISVKSTSSPSIEKFFYDTAKYQYELSEGMYQEVLSKVTGREFRTTMTIMYQTVEPYGVAVFWWNPEDIELGRHKFLQAHQTLIETLEKGIWPGYDVYAEQDHFGIINFQLPWWSAKGLEERNQEGMRSFHPTGDID